MDDRSFAGWGIRTVASGEARYNPLSYQVSGTWSFDTATFNGNNLTKSQADTTITLTATNACFSSHSPSDGSPQSKPDRLCAGRSGAGAVSLGCRTSAIEHHCRFHSGTWRKAFASL